MQIACIYWPFQIRIRNERNFPKSKYQHMVETLQLLNIDIYIDTAWKLHAYVMLIRSTFWTKKIRHEQNFKKSKW